MPEMTEYHCIEIWKKGNKYWAKTDINVDTDGPQIGKEITEETYKMLAGIIDWHHALNGDSA